MIFFRKSDILIFFLRKSDILDIFSENPLLGPPIAQKHQQIGISKYSHVIYRWKCLVEAKNENKFIGPVMVL